eukprot:755437-Hanusia_phi.AAC.3
MTQAGDRINVNGSKGNSKSIRCKVRSIQKLSSKNAGKHKYCLYAGIVLHGQPASRHSLSLRDPALHAKTILRPPVRYRLGRDPGAAAARSPGIVAQ